MNKLEFKRTNGNVPKALPGMDHISALLYYLSDEELPEGFTAADRIHPVSTLETAEGLGITGESDSWNVRNLHYQLSQVYRINPGISLYVGLFAPAVGAGSFAEIKQLQNFANGDIRQMAIWNGSKEFSAADLTAIQGMATALEAQDVPLSILYAPKVGVPSALPKGVAGEGKGNVSVVIGQDGSGVAAALHADADRSGASVSGVGVVLGLLSVAKVHESIGWVGRFPTGVSLPAFGDGTLYRSLDKAVIDSLDASRYIFFRTFSGLAGSFVNDSHNMDAPSSDYNSIELVRTMDKAVRGIRAYLLPELGSPIYVDPQTGQLAPATVKYLEVVASQQLSDMEKAAELSGFSVEIDPDQDVAATSTVEFVIKNVAVGVFRKGSVSIGYSKSI